MDKQKSFFATGICKAVILASTMLATPAAHAQTEQEPLGVDFTLGVTSDSFFGFAPYVNGSYELDETLDFTVYGIFWSGGTGAAWGNWSEFGAGVNIDLGDGFAFKPQLGFTSGNLLSSNTQGPTVFGDGIVPNLYLTMDKPQWEGEIYAGYYAPLREEGQTTSSFIHYWANAGYKFTSAFSAGAHYEQLYGGSENNEVNVYQWIGPYVQLKDPKGRGFFRVSGGWDIADETDANNSFYKMTFGVNF